MSKRYKADYGEQMLLALLDHSVDNLHLLGTNCHLMLNRQFRARAKPKTLFSYLNEDTVEFFLEMGLDRWDIVPITFISGHPIVLQWAKQNYPTRYWTRRLWQWAAYLPPYSTDLVETIHNDPGWGHKCRKKSECKTSRIECNLIPTIVTSLINANRRDWLTELFMDHHHFSSHPRFLEAIISLGHFDLLAKNDLQRWERPWAGKFWDKVAELMIKHCQWTMLRELIDKHSDLKLWLHHDIPPELLLWLPVDFFDGSVGLNLIAAIAPHPQRAIIMDHVDRVKPWFSQTLHAGLGDLEALQKLHETEDLDPRHCDHELTTALLCGQTRVLDWAMDSGWGGSIDGSNYFHESDHCFGRCDIRGLEWAVSEGIDLHAADWMAQAIRADRLDLLPALLECIGRGWEKDDWPYFLEHENYNGEHKWLVLLKIAIETGRTSAVNALMRLVPCPRSAAALGWACKRGSVEMLKCLLRNGFHPLRFDGPMIEPEPCMWKAAIKHGNLACLEFCQVHFDPPVLCFEWLMVKDLPEIWEMVIIHEWKLNFDGQNHLDERALQRIECLQVRGSSAWSNATLTTRLAQDGNLNWLIWAKDLGCPWTIDVFEAAIANSDSEMQRYFTREQWKIEIYWLTYYIQIKWQGGRLDWVVPKQVEVGCFVGSWDWNLAVPWANVQSESAFQLQGVRGGWLSLTAQPVEPQCQDAFLTLSLTRHPALIYVLLRMILPACRRASVQINKLITALAPIVAN